MQSEWRPVPGFEGVYEASCGGQVRRVGSAKVLRPSLSASNPYLRVVLCRNGKPRTLTVHSVVCSAFNGDRPSERHTVAHCNGDPGDNRAANLRWATQSQNLADKHLHGTHTWGDTHPTSKLRQADVTEMRSARSGGATLAELAGRFCISVAQVSRVVNRQNWRGPVAA